MNDRKVPLPSHGKSVVAQPDFIKKTLNPFSLLAYSNEYSDSDSDGDRDGDGDGDGDRDGDGDGDGDGDTSNTSNTVATNSSDYLPYTKKIPMYIIHVGSQPILFEATNPTPYNLTHQNNTPSFYTKCIYCQYMSHAPNQCPLNLS